VVEWLRPQKRFAHLFAADAPDALAEVQAQVDADWADLVERCRP
jgi:hypothetical protein